MWKANGKTTTLQLFLDSLSPKTLGSEEAMDLSRDRNELLLSIKGKTLLCCIPIDALQNNFVSS
jgi:hypothetical protein